MVFRGANDLASAAAARVVGRHLLDHCFKVTGGHGHTVVAPPSSNATAEGGAESAEVWAGVDEGAVHVDPYTVRLIFWLVHTLAALGLLILMLTW